MGVWAGDLTGLWSCGRGGVRVEVAGSGGGGARRGGGVAGGFVFTLVIFSLAVTAALDAIAAGNIELARRLLEEVQFKYPDSSLNKRAREIRASLGAGHAP